MRCDEIWGRYSDCLNEGRYSDSLIDEHLKDCPACSYSIRILQVGLSGLKEDIEREEPGRFWMDMRREVRRNIKIPERGGSWFHPWWNTGWAVVSILIMVFAFRGFIFSDAYTPEEKEFFLGSIDPVSSAYEDAITHTVPADDYNSEADYYRGIIDWSSLLIDAYDKGLDLERRDQNEEKVSWGISGIGPTNG